MKKKIGITLGIILVVIQFIHPKKMKILKYWQPILQK